MAKPTDEIISLPTFSSHFIAKDGDDFTERQISLSDLQKDSDKGLILYFYPKDNTSGCSTQAQDFTAHLAEFTALGYTIVGVSRDSVESHKKFIDNKQIGFALISDSDEKLCDHFSTIGEKNMYGKTVVSLIRSTFVFDKTGKLTHAQRNLRAKGYAERLLQVLSD